MKSLLLAFLLLGIGVCANNAQAGSNSDPTRSLAIVSRDGKTHEFQIELALTPQQQVHGLMGRTKMAKDAGMLFYFPKEDERAFWMKDTLIPLDMLFIKKDGTIHSIHDSAKPNDLTSVKSNGPVQAVLELNGGTAKHLGIKAGDKVRHVFFGN